MALTIHPSWEKHFSSFMNTEKALLLRKFIVQEYLTKKIFPHPSNLFRAFNLCPFDKVKVVILGQDPYHNNKQADGLAFSVPQGVDAPPSLVNIFKEIKDDIGQAPTTYDLSAWATQGVLLLNSILTVVAHNAASHRGKGWEECTDFAIKTLSDKREHIVFMLWGNYAKEKASLIDTSKHLVLTALHPSPFSAYNGFFGCKHFSLANAYLEKHGQTPIRWS